MHNIIVALSDTGPDASNPIVMIVIALILWVTLCIVLLSQINQQRLLRRRRERFLRETKRRNTFIQAELGKDEDYIQSFKYANPQVPQRGRHK